VIHATVRNPSGPRLLPVSTGPIVILVGDRRRGSRIHVQDIAHVINYDLPEIAENSFTAVGRTGRAAERSWLPRFTAATRSDLLHS